MEKQIFVFGDRFDHRAIIQKPPGHDSTGPKTGFGRRYNSYFDKTGAPFVAKTINYALTNKENGPAQDVLEGDQPTVELMDIYEYAFKDKLKTKDEKRTLRRISRYFSDRHDLSRIGSRGLPSAGRSSSDTSKFNRIGVFIDYDVDFRKSYAAKDKLDQWKGSDFRDLNTIIIAIGDGLNQACVESYEALSQILLKDKNYADRTIVLLKLKALQSAGIDVTDATTLEASARQLKREFAASCTNKTARALLRIAHHLVVVGDNGTIYLNKNDAHIQFMPNFKPTNATYVSNQLGIYISSLVAHALADTSIGEAANVNGSIRLALLAYSHLFNSGIGADRDKDGTNWSPFEALPKILAPSRVEKGDLKEIIEDKKGTHDEYLFSTLEFKLDKPEWKRTDCYVNDLKGLGSHSGETVFHRIIQKGIDHGLRFPRTSGSSGGAGRASLPKAKIQCPYAQFGKIKLVDDTEIEQYSNCRRIIRNYLNNKGWHKPLSIAVFGTPGIGKSFAVQQLVKINKDDSEETPLVFNLAQFDSLDQLTQCFHTIQSAVLASKDNPPLIMFDEFDSDFLTPLGWLKYFLAPMQDGEFRGKTGTYKIGRAIFAFAGGTSETFQDFRTRDPSRLALKSKAGALLQSRTRALPSRPRVGRKTN